MANLQDHDVPDVSPSVLMALSSLDMREVSLPEVLANLRTVVAFDRAVLLERWDDECKCIVALPAELEGRCWPTAPVFEQVLRGEVCLLLSCDRTPEDEAEISPGLVPPGQVTLCL